MTIILEEPSGWILIPLDDSDPSSTHTNHNNINNSASNPGIMTHIIQIVVMLNHQNGRDSHIRQIKLFNLRNNNVSSLQSEPLNHSSRSGITNSINPNRLDEIDQLTGQEFLNYSYLR